MYETKLSFTREEMFKALGIDGAMWERFLQFQATDDGSHLDVNPIRLLDALEQYVDKQAYLRRNPAEKTRRQYGHILNLFARYVKSTAANAMINEVTVPWVERFLQHYANDRTQKGVVSNSTWNQRLSVLRAFFQWCQDMNYIKKHPLTNRDIRHKQQRRLQQPAVPTTLQAERMLNAVRESRYVYRNCALLTIFLTTGGRLNEVISLQEDDLRLQTKRIHFLGKGEKDRTVPLEDGVCDFLQEYLADLPRIRKQLGVSAEHDKYLFYSHEGQRKGQPIGARAVQDMVQRVLKKLDFPKTPDFARISVHKLRHYYAVTKLQSGTSLYDLRRYLGHESIETTMVYLAALSDEHLRKEIEARFPVTPEIQRRIKETRRGGLRLIEKVDEQ